MRRNSSISKLLGRSSARDDQARAGNAGVKPPTASTLTSAGTCRVPVRRDVSALGTDYVAEEVPIALEYNGISHAVMLATPLDLEDFALGFSLTEEIVDRPSDVRDIAIEMGSHGITVQLQIASSCFVRLKDKRRSLTGKTGCGLCGVDSLLQAASRPRPLTAGPQFSASAVSLALRTLDALQPLRKVTGATHAAGFSDPQGQVLLVREDVGRHNALDKLVGAMLANGIQAGRGFVVVTSRASYEMAGKTARAGCSLLAAVSGVTGLAIDLAHDANLTLLGFARGDSFNIYTHPERILWTPST